VYKNETRKRNLNILWVKKYAEDFFKEKRKESLKKRYGGEFITHVSKT